MKIFRFNNKKTSIEKRITNQEKLTIDILQKLNNLKEKNLVLTDKLDLIIDKYLKALKNLEFEYIELLNAMLKNKLEIINLSQEKDFDISEYINRMSIIIDEINKGVSLDKKELYCNIHNEIDLLIYRINETKIYIREYRKHIENDKKQPKELTICLMNKYKTYVETIKRYEELIKKYEERLKLYHM